MNSSGENGLSPDQRHQAIKAELKTLTKARKQLPKTDTEAKAELSKQIKAAKRALHELHQETSSQSTEPLPAPTDAPPLCYLQRHVHNQRGRRGLG